MLFANGYRYHMRNIGCPMSLDGYGVASGHLGGAGRHSLSSGCFYNTHQPRCLSWPQRPSLVSNSNRRNRYQHQRNSNGARNGQNNSYRVNNSCDDINVNCASLFKKLCLKNSPNDDVDCNTYSPSIALISKKCIISMKSVLGVLLMLGIMSTVVGGIYFQKNNYSHTFKNNINQLLCIIALICGIIMLLSSGVLFRVIFGGSKQQLIYHHSSSFRDSESNYQRQQTNNSSNCPPRTSSVATSLGNQDPISTTPSTNINSDGSVDIVASPRVQIDSPSPNIQHHHQQQQQQQQQSNNDNQPPGSTTHDHNIAMMMMMLSTTASSSSNITNTRLHDDQPPSYSEYALTSTSSPPPPPPPINYVHDESVTPPPKYSSGPPPRYSQLDVRTLILNDNILDNHSNGSHDHDTISIVPTNESHSNCCDEPSPRIIDNNCYDTTIHNNTIRHIDNSEDNIENDDNNTACHQTERSFSRNPILYIEHFKPC